ncbi:hypothetical protein BU16DRAFT_530675 [Lophium mytilinum]|uniref:G-patch domain-containing protein n=1 Tax=Lophium mytilinum TaxID=390894 RepID=A0A6A6QG72_9PEZI|nr:hypothetical protein BU16DRAFT_530675 [Lophium mytilinum]
MPTAEAPVGLKTTTFSEFTKNTANDDSYNPSQGKRHRGGRNKNKSKWPKPQYEEEEEPTDVDWDAVYVQGQPTSWNQWKTSSEKYRSVFEWKQKLKSTSFSSESRASEETPSDDPTAKRQRLSASITPHSTQRSTSSSEEPAMHAGLGATFPQIQPHTAQMTDNEHDASISQPQSSKLPGKAGFAKRMMEKMGHVKGQGLGPEGKGIIESLYTQTDKSRGRGGRGGQFGGANRTQIAVIKGGRRAKEEEDDPRDKPSPVIVIFGLLDGVTRGDDEARNDGGIRQEIGDYCKIFGILEKVSPVWGTGHAQAPVFVKFGSDIGAHVALDHFNDPTKAGAFQGKGTSAKFYNLEQFELGVYE